jgi:hypothetical protein
MVTRHGTRRPSLRRRGACVPSSTTRPLRAYVAAAAFLDARSKEALFQSARGHCKTLSGQGMAREDVFAMVKRRCAAAAHAGHASTRTTQLYNPKSRKIQRAEKASCLPAPTAKLKVTAGEVTGEESKARIVVERVRTKLTLVAACRLGAALAP